MSLKNKKKIVLACSECFSRNYTSSKSNFLGNEKIELNKYCPNCNKHTLHKETK